MTEREAPYVSRDQAGRKPTLTAAEAAHIEARQRMDDTRPRIGGTESGRRFLERMQQLGVR